LCRCDDSVDPRKNPAGRKESDQPVSDLGLQPLVNFVLRYRAFTLIAAAVVMAVTIILSKG